MCYPRRVSWLLLLASGWNTISPATAVDRPAFEPGDAAPISSKVSLVHLGSVDSFTITEQGTLAGRLLLNALENKDMTEAAAAKVVYHAIVPKEHYGGEYTALEWFCDYLIGTKDDQRAQLADRFHRSFFDFFAQNDYANLKEYLGRKYKLKEFADAGTNDGRDRLSFLEDFILFNNPRREEWERTSKIIECLKIQPGTTIADVGSGPGYYSFKFAELTGASGKVYAIDTVQNHLDYVQNVCREFGISNVETMKDRADGISLNPDTADLVFMCSLYHIIYTTSTEEVKDRFVASVKDALKPDGRLVIVDNAVVQDGQLPYHGPHIAKELVIGQLYYYGFDLTEQHQFIPQRYVLIFKKRT
ncbi:MAG: class I SAM-dependent methyltransferase [Verrucomicrobia bacterium]|nr:class I SAM-dependent methyltransferase [Verrucomicrobiota bacterium]